MGLIEVSDIRIYAHHGCLEEEAVIGSEYIVDVGLEADLSISTESDELSETLDYVVVNRIVKEEMAVRSKLIEHVAGRIIKRLKEEFPKMQSAKVKVSKITPPINGNVDRVSVTLSS